MLKSLLAAAVLVSAVSSASAQWGSNASSSGVRVETSAQPAHASVTSEPAHARASSGPIITRGQIASLKAVLKLRSDQQSYWTTVEAALLDLSRSSAVADTVSKLRRLKTVAGPLLKTLDDSQRSEAVAFAHRIGYGRLAAAF
jgi:hypothetical protein